MTIATIVAHDPNLVIGKDGDLPWHYTDDLKNFKNITMGHPLLMGRGVFEELNEKPLPGRTNVVLSRSQSYDNVATFSSVNKALRYLCEQDLIFVIGGSQVYRQMLPKTDKLFVTEVHDSYAGDTWFPEYRNEIGSTWKEIKRDDREELSFVVYARMN